MADSNRNTANIPDNSPENLQISQPKGLRDQNLYTISALARELGISRQALHKRVKAGNLPSTISIVPTPSGQVLLRYPS